MTGITPGQNENDRVHTTVVEKQPRRKSNIVLWGLVLAMVGSNGYLLWKVNELKAANDTVAMQMQTKFEATQSRFAETQTNAAREIALLRDELAEADERAAKAAGQARAQASRHADKLAKRLSDLQREQQERFNTEITTVRETAEAGLTQIGEVQTQVGEVDARVAETSDEVAQLTDNLFGVVGDMGVMSGKIATNADELAALKALGERDYFEFDITKRDEPARVGDITIDVKKVDAKRGKYTINVFVDDRMVQKKARSLHEPVQFYRGRGSQPSEIVVYEMENNRLVGYLASPKTADNGREKLSD